jgi:uroporphyrinogen decarboxylase
VQIFDSWAGILDEAGFAQFCEKPIAGIVRRVRESHREVPVIGFPRGAGSRFSGFRAASGVDAVGLDWTVPMAQARSLQRQGAVQGNLDPLRLVAGGSALEEGVASILDNLSSGPLVFNLGHGIVPQTPISHVETMLKLVRGRG